MRLILVLTVVAGSWLSAPLGHAASATPAPTKAPAHRPAAPPHASGQSHRDATPAPRETARAADPDPRNDDGTLRRLFRSIDDSHRDHSDRNAARPRPPEDSTPGADRH